MYTAYFVQVYLTMSLSFVHSSAEPSYNRTLSYPNTRLRTNHHELA